MRYLFLVLFISCNFSVFSQFFSKLNYSVEANAIIGKGEFAPFWLTSNRHGVGYIDTPGAYLRASLIKPYQEDKRFSYSWGFDLVGGESTIHSIYGQQYFFSIKYNPISLEVGAVERNPELRNPILSSGSLTLSNNARPIPQARLGVEEYYTIPLTRDWFHLKGHLAYGLFIDNKFQRQFTSELDFPSHIILGKRVENAIFHSKALYAKVENYDLFPLSFEGGLEMVSRFGGKVYLNDGTSFKAPSGIKDFLRVLIPLKGGSDSPIMDQQNVLGDHLGSWNFRLNYKLRDWMFRLYYEHQFNDHSQLFGEYSWRDGFWGVEVSLPQNKIIDTFVFERIESRDQSGAIYHDSNGQIPEQISAVDDYYNHGMYSGWQHNGYAIANPLFISPIYNDNHRLHFSSNRIVANHVGISGSPFPFLGYRMLYSYTDHWGTYIQPYQEVMYSHNYLFELVGSLPKSPSWKCIAAFAIDRSNIIGNNWGFSFSISKSGILN